MKNLKVLALGAAIASSLMSGAAMAEMSANAALTTNYVWRGMTLSDDSIAVQGGVDWSDKSGAYAGVWASTIDSVDSSLEIDLYGGYTFGNYDVGVLIYTVDDDILGDSDVMELKLAGDFDVSGTAVGAELYISLDEPTDASYQYLTVNGEFDVEGFGVTPYLGMYSGDYDGMHYGVTASKTFADMNGIEFSATLDISDADISDDTFVYVMASKSFDL